MGTLPLPPKDIAELKAFCAPQADRYSILSESLRRRGLHFLPLTLHGARHLLVPSAPSRSWDAAYYRINLMAHWDRVPTSPGANDNAAAVFQILAHLETAKRLHLNHRSQAIFTDKEELSEGALISSQGSSILARELRRRNVNNLLFLVLDMCGIGDVPVWGRSLRKAGRATDDAAMDSPHTSMENFLKRFTRGLDFGIKLPFSDDLGLLLEGYPALQLSILPRSEALGMTKTLGPANSSAQSPGHIRTSLPPSWNSHHGPDDDVESLQPGAFLLVSRILRELDHIRFPLPKH